MKAVLCFLFCLVVSLFQNIDAAYIVVKKTGEKVVALDESDKKNTQAIWSVFKKYQWPMCLANKNLTKDEIRELFFSEKNVEELFLRRKLKEIHERYDLLFVPTVLAQLFLLLNVYNNEMDVSQLGVSIFNKKYSNKITIYSRLDIEVTVLLEEPGFTMEDIYESYEEVIDPMEKGYFTFSKNFFNWLLLLELGESEKNKNSSDIENVAEQVLCKLIKNVLESYESTIKKLALNRNFLNHELMKARELIAKNGKQMLHSDSLLKKCLRLEYKARKENKFLLFRGDKFIKQSCNISGKSLLVDSTFPSKYKKFGKHTKKIFNRGSDCRSISYSNNILDGVINDLGACTYSYYLKGSKCVYALLLSKARYWLNGHNNLFFVSPLDYLNATFADGEFFHSRSKGSLDKGQHSKGETLEMSGIAACVADRIGLITVERDPFLHEAIFSDVFKKNAIFLYGKDKEKRVKDNREKAARFYHTIHLIKKNERLIQDKAKELLGKENKDNQNIPVNLSNKK